MDDVADSSPHSLLHILFIAAVKKRYLLPITQCLFLREVLQDITLTCLSVMFPLFLYSLSVLSTLLFSYFYVPLYHFFILLCEGI